MKAILLAFLTSNACAACLTAPVVDVVDGDTIAVRIQMIGVVDGQAAVMNRPKDPTRWLVRVRGIDTPELRSRCETDELRAREREAGHKAREAGQELVREAGGKVRLCNRSFDRYGRILADVWVNDAPYWRLMLDLGHAQPHEGAGKAVTWCGR